MASSSSFIEDDSSFFNDQSSRIEGDSCQDSIIEDSLINSSNRSTADSSGDIIDDSYESSDKTPKSKLHESFKLIRTPASFESDASLEESVVSDFEDARPNTSNISKNSSVNATNESYSSENESNVGISEYIKSELKISENKSAELENTDSEEEFSHKTALIRRARIIRSDSENELEPPIKNNVDRSEYIKSQLKISQTGSAEFENTYSEEETSPKTALNHRVRVIVSDSENEEEKTLESNIVIPKYIKSELNVSGKLENMSIKEENKHKKSFGNEDVIDVSSDDEIETQKISQKSLNHTILKQTTLDKIVKKTPQGSTKTENSTTLHSLKTNLAQALHVQDKQNPNEDTVFCTRKEYTVQATKVGTIRTDLKRTKQLLITIDKRNLPDGGVSLHQRAANLEQELRKEEQILTKMVVETSNNGNTHGGAASIAWEQLQEGSAAVIPKTFGKQALETLNFQKSVTMDRLKDLHGSLATCPREDEIAEVPNRLTVELMVHQKRALAWLLWREKQKPSGGILADDMGLGKTLTMISLIMKTMEITAERGERDIDSDKENDDDDEDGLPKQKASSKTFPQGGTLVICPATLIKQWEGEVDKRTKRGTLTVEVYHGANREDKPNRLARQDMVVTTYNLAMRESVKKGPLYRIKWHRVILDEAHVVRNHKSQTSIAMCALKAKSRWALTGTPVHNKELDLYALLKFLRCSPFDDLQIWKRWVDNKNAGGQDRLNTVMRTLMLRRTKLQLQENDGTFQLPEKTYELLQVKLDKNETQVYQKILIFSRTLFAQFLHQRTEKNVDLMYSRQAGNPSFLKTQSNDPNGEYYKLHKKMLKMQGTQEIKSHEILVLLLRLRQICCHPSLITTMIENGSYETEGIEEDDVDINILDKLSDLNLDDEDTFTPQSTANSTPSTSTQQGETLSDAASKILNTNNPIFDKNRPNEKINKVIEILLNVIEAGDKAVVVSQWTSMLNIVRWHCENASINCDTLDGSVPVIKRNDLVSNFNKQTHPMKVLLLSLTAGGVGLNLVGGNHLVLLDLHWNPQLESQAQDRIYRVGQTKKVHIYKLMTLDTIEERIKALQDNKLQMASDVLSGTKVQPGSKLSMDDLRMLFSI